MEKRDGRSGFENIIGLIILVALGIWIYNSWFRADQWQMMYEKEIDNVIHAGEVFETREACVAYINQLRLSDSANPSGNYNYECGSNCKPPATLMGTYRCEETAD